MALEKMDLEKSVSSHYTHGALEAAIVDALRANGADIDKLRAQDLSGADEFHTGWRPATLELARALGLTPGQRVLDIGSGLGGPARTFAVEFGCRVDGIDLTPEYVQVARALTSRCGLTGKVTFIEASALAIPSPNATFDRATLIHVGMNIEDKDLAFAEAGRVLKPDALFGVYDLMITAPSSVSNPPVPYPMPWAQTEATSFLETPTVYRKRLEDAGFVVEQERNMRDFCLDLAKGMRAASSTSGATPLALHILLGPASPQRFKNVMQTVEAGILAPVMLIARKL